MKEMPTAVHGTLRKSFLRVPEVIRQCSGINVFGKRIKSLAYTTDLAIIRNINAEKLLNEDRTEVKNIYEEKSEVQSEAKSDEQQSNKKNKKNEKK